jgi:hypothetical protein
MRDPNYLLAIDALLTVCVIFDLRRVLSTGRARLWMRGTATREHQPARYWRYVYSSWGVLTFCIALFVAVMLRAVFPIDTAMRRDNRAQKRNDQQPAF